MLCVRKHSKKSYPFPEIIPSINSVSFQRYELWLHISKRMYYVHSQIHAFLFLYLLLNSNFIFTFMPFVEKLEKTEGSIENKGTVMPVWINNYQKYSILPLLLLENVKNVTFSKITLNPIYYLHEINYFKTNLYFLLLFSSLWWDLSIG